MKKCVFYSTVPNFITLRDLQIHYVSVQKGEFKPKKKGMSNKDRENSLHINITIGKQNFQKYLMYKGDLPTISRFKL